MLLFSLVNNGWLHLTTTIRLQTVRRQFDHATNFRRPTTKTGMFVFNGSRRKWKLNSSKTTLHYSRPVGQRLLHSVPIRHTGGTAAIPKTSHVIASTTPSHIVAVLVRVHIQRQQQQQQRYQQRRTYHWQLTDRMSGRNRSDERITQPYVRIWRRQQVCVKLICAEFRRLTCRPVLESFGPVYRRL